MPRLFIAAAALLMTALPALAFDAPEGWITHNTDQAYGDLVKSVRAAVKTAPINIVTQASASDGARNQGIDIPGNRVFGLYRNDYARRMLAASIPAGIQAPIRMYVTENADGTATLSYVPPSTVFAPYMDTAAPDLATLASELDAIFQDIAEKSRNP